jgi:predicted dinucleotide-binding enzyme
MSPTPPLPAAVAILGTGNVGRALARGMARAGAAVTIGSRDPASVEAPAGVRVASSAEAVRTAEVVVLAVPVPALAELVRSLPLPDGVVVVDATNAVRTPVPDGHPTVAHHLAALAPHARVVKAFNTVGAEHLDGTPVEGRPTFLPIAGDDGARSVVAALATAMGFEVAELGDLDAVPLVEAHAQLWITLAIMRGWGRDWTLTVARPGRGR